MFCKGFTIPNFNPKKDNFFLMLHFTCRAKYPNVGIPVFSTPLTICEVKFIFTSPINHLT